jgi:hypothetical protein
MNTNANFDMLAASEEQIMNHYAKIHLNQSAQGAMEFAQSMLKFNAKHKLSNTEWRRALKLGNRPVKARLDNWSFDSSMRVQDFEQCLNRNVKYGNGGATTRILGYDLEARRVLTQTGSIYELK